MRVAVVQRPEAETDIASAFEYYVREAGIDVAARFIDGIAETLEFIATNPSVGSPRNWFESSLSGIRSWHVVGFDKFRVYYLARPDSIEVIRVLHGARDLPSLLEE